MRPRDIDPARVRALNARSPARGRFVLYWMQQSQRAECNHALEHAIDCANHLGQPLIAVFGVMDDYPEANLRHFRFMLEGLAETQAALRRRGIPLVIRRGHPADVALDMAEQASLLTCDRGYLRHQKQWRARVAREARCLVIQVEADLIVPVEEASSRAEWAARTIRPKIARTLDRFLVPLRHRRLKLAAAGSTFDGMDLSDLDSALASLMIDRSVAASGRIRGGTREAKRRLARFLRGPLARYVKHRHRPELDDVSMMSPYLHFGQISPLFIAMAVRRCAAPRSERAAYLEELIVRRELAHNFCHYVPRYDAFEAVPRWARQALRRHATDRRSPRYSLAQLDAARTHDDSWNAAMLEMKHTGFMHNAMRMYWGKKIIEWARSPRTAYRYVLHLNNRYFIDGRDANSYANVGWLFGLHDRPWAERPIFGTVRYMNAAGLKRKGDPEAYIRKVRGLAPPAAGGA